MAFSKILVVATAFASLVTAAPLNIPRDVTSVVTETAYTTVDVPVTLWVDENGKPIRTEVPAQAGNFAEHAPTSELKSSALPSTTTSTSVSIPTNPIAQTVAPVVPTTTPASPAPTPAQTTSAAPTVEQAANPPQSQWTPPAAISSSAPVQPVQYTQPSQPVATPTNTPSSGQGGVCQGSGSGCVGDITHWDGGLGACGWNVNTNSDMQIAMPVGLMGAQSNGNPYCGKSLTIKNPNTGATVQATVGDKCMGCTGDSIDLTNALFAAIGGGCDGRCSGFQWWFN